MRVLDPAPAGQRLRLGNTTTLRATAGGGWLLEEEHTLIGDAALSLPGLPGVEWLAPPRGFLRRCRALPGA